MVYRVKDSLIGKKFGRLTVLHQAPSHPVWRMARWDCICECGTRKTVNGRELKHSKEPSCGCVAREAVSKTHKKYTSLEVFMNNTESRSVIEGMSDCLEWRGHTVNGYGFIGSVRSKYKARKTGLAHRLVFELVNGYLPEVVMHACDNRKCINPEHLRGGTQSENIKDAHNKGRTYAKINSFRVAHNGETLSLKELADVLGVSYETIRARYRNGKRGDALKKQL